MSIKGVLADDSGIRELDRIITILKTENELFDDALVELSLFFIRHLKTNLLPVSKETEFLTPVQKQVYLFLDSKYQSFCDYLNNGEYPITESVESSIGSLLLFDPSKKLIPAAASAFIQNKLFSKIDEVISMNDFQESVYSLLINDIEKNHDITLDVLVNDFPNSKPSKAFSSLFLNFIKLELDENDIIKILNNFDCILSRVDDKLITYDFLNEQFKKSSILASLALPNLVIVAKSRAVDSPKFYNLAFNAISPQSLSSPHRSKFLETLISVLSPKTRPASQTAAFAVKLSRMLPIIPIDAQLDVLTVLHTLVRSHDCVAELLNPIEGPVSNVYGELEECQPQTLWEVRALRSSQATTISEEAKTLEHRWVPHDFCSFKLLDSVENCKSKSTTSEKIGNWCSGLDQGIWNFH